MEYVLISLLGVICIVIAVANSLYGHYDLKNHFNKQRNSSDED